ncbi:DUF429 domain-containing protein [Geminicoccus roseus]|uniref:DUF429 domain-containing protein n=1 Tax=Geminicoccus roseus TaxID=404900 RepID=UPI00041AB763|nr:DUF429 domain-containing protein [Geminicoccus roseus]
MKIIGVDFTSRPSKRKPITCASCHLAGGLLRFEAFLDLPSFADFEAVLSSPGPWIAGIDFPFGMPLRFLDTVEADEWRRPWPDYVAHARSLGRSGFRDALERYKAPRPVGDKEHRRAADQAARSISPQKLYGVPVALMFFEGAVRLIQAGVHVPLLHATGDPRVVVEAYPGVLARRLIGKRSYKSDDRRKQTAEQKDARAGLLEKLLSPSLAHGCGVRVEAPAALAEDPSGDRLDALLCAVQAAWAWRERDRNYGIPAQADRREGWISDPGLHQALDGSPA